ncbi:MAG: DUF983 domain-containing protein [Actinomycetota bacterium]|nr:DUF983 domain-containing protein [Actinomycetota bacterium]
MTSARPRPSAGRMVARGLAKRCAVCGQGHLFTGWFRMVERCPRCGYRFEREEGFFLGAYVINLAITEGLLLVLGMIPAIILLASNPDAPLAPIMIAAFAAAVLGPVLFYPWSRTIWVAIDLIIRPLEAREPADRG